MGIFMPTATLYISKKKWPHTESHRMNPKLWHTYSHGVITIIYNAIAITVELWHAQHLIEAVCILLRKTNGLARLAAEMRLNGSLPNLAIDFLSLH